MAENRLIEALEGMPTEFLSCMLDVLPMEFSVIDADDKVKFWNKHETRIFKRPQGVLGKNVRNCHPERSLDKVLKVIERLRSGESDHVDFWIDLPEDDKPRKLLIRYYAIRNRDGEYLGILETNMNITPLQKITGENRLGDMA
jgi:PAS domain S-box-containing protein